MRVYVLSSTLGLEPPKSIAEPLLHGTDEDGERKTDKRPNRSAEPSSHNEPYDNVDERNQHHPAKDDERDGVKEHGIPRCIVLLVQQKRTEKPTGGP